MPNAIVGIDNYLIDQLNSAFSKGERIRINVAFLMESGVKLIGSELKKAARRGAKIQVLTGSYMKITEPSALYYLIDILEDNVDIRLYDDKTRIFHPKAYIIDHKKESEVFIGSSNISKSALTYGVEWNYKLLKNAHPDDYRKFSDTFDRLFHFHSLRVTPQVLKKYASTWKKSDFFRELPAYTIEEVKETGVTPRGAQIEALYELRKAREEGITKGLVIAATGVGKTYLAAFDSINFEKVLFVAHREEILNQAERSFKHVRPEDSSGFFSGNRKDMGTDICFATIQTLAREHNLGMFPRGYYDYIIMDEFHHAAADSYLKVLEYFNPNFLLGLTATPYRMDNRDIFTLCEDNVIYELYLKDAIQRDLLVPFKYYGIYDSTDYEKIPYRNGSYIIEDLEKELSKKERAKDIYENYIKFGKKKCLGFCASIKHTEYMTRFFNSQGVRAAAVHSGGTDNENVMGRKEAVEGIQSGKIDVIFSIDIFNEGVDIPAVDFVMFLRPTESFVVFLQQLGRGLRKYPEKEYLTVLDFIGNYKKAHYIPYLLSGENPLRQQKTRRPLDNSYPDGCHVQFDMKVLSLFEELAKTDPLPKRMRDEYFRIKDKLGRRPTRLDMYEGSDIPIREYLKRGWLAYLKSLGELLPEEQKWVGTAAEDFLQTIEKTSMTKSYKIPTIGAFLQQETILPKVHLDAIGKNFRDFYVEHPLHQKDFKDKSNKDWRRWKQADFTKLARKNPVFFLNKNKYFHFDEVNKIFSLNEKLSPYLSILLSEHVKDILAFKRIHYFRRRFKEED